ncbi:cobalamin biosynthesis protein CbiG [Phaeobacter sp. CECT 5382]|uniref:cobalamin biosynthesis protein n=1 Tax=Rhodobacterales TaxID=204455 RepID=UPI0006DB22E4|nr:cobalamin biosynthesis protein [Phaeobacter sp. CECT 5382]CUH88025.1 cobalamin biosynthesis protein CbiG [Phaeobacter sp. CECT 5382]
MKVAGIGFRATATLADLRAALALVGTQPDALASVTDRADMPALKQLAKEMQLPLLALAETDIAGEQTLTCSPRIKARFATGSLAEACALVAARKGTPGMAPARSRLIAPRSVTADGLATAAIAERLEP